MTIDTPNSIKKDPEEILGECFDKENLSLKDRLGNEEYEKLRRQFILDGQFDSSLGEEIYAELFDDVTGLRRREGLFKKATRRLKELYGIPSSDKQNKIDWYSLFNNHEINEIFHKIYFMMGDISFLCVANRASHNEGDRLLREISEVVGSELGECFRHGGDKITCLVESSKEKAEEKLKIVKDRVSKLQNVANLKNYNLKPNIDLGMASLAEAITLYRIINVDKTGNRFEGQVALKGLQNLWLRIAESRASVNKAKERMDLLMRRRENSEIILDELRKPVYDISDEELDELIETIGRGGSKDQWVKDFIVRHEMDVIEKEANPYKRLEEETILNYIIK